MSPGRSTAWGRSWIGLGDVPVLLPATHGLPGVAVRVTEDPLLAATPPAPVVWGQDHAAFSLRAGGRIAIDRSPGAVELRLPRPTTPECIVAPHLASAAAALATWDGGIAVHGGSFRWAGRAWALVGDKEAGKSTTLGLLARRGVPVLADDVTIVAAGRVMAGPRCVDLRPEVAATLGMGRDLGVVGTRQRWRLDLPDVDVTAPFGGLVELRWGSPGIRPLAAAERIRLLHRNPVLPIPAIPSAPVVEAAACPAWVWSRPKGGAGLDRHVDLLLKAIET